MKYVKIDPFEKHLNESLPDHPSDIYFLFLEESFERLFLAKRIASKLKLDVLYCEDERLLEQLESPFLFAEKRVIICDETQQKDIPKVSDLILIFTGKKAPPFYKKTEKEGTTLDLLKEKPWDRKSRLQWWLLEYARDREKSLSVAGATYLINFSHANFAILLQELDKIIAYSGEKKDLTLEMIKEICSLDPVRNGWQISETVVLGGLLHCNQVDLYSLIGQLRYQLRLGIQITMSKELSDISPKKIEKFQKSGLKSSYFMEGLKDLFYLEMKMRSSTSNQQLLFDQFRAKLAARR